MKTKIKGVEIARSPEGLALSSRNQYLNILEKEIALFLPLTLKNLALELRKNSNIK
jgi:pantothenate synthetase